MKYSASPQFLCTACRRSRKKYLEASEMESRSAERSERSFWKVIQEMASKMLELDKTPRKLQRLQLFCCEPPPSHLQSGTASSVRNRKASHMQATNGTPVMKSDPIYSQMYMRVGWVGVVVVPQRDRPITSRK